MKTTRADVLRVARDFAGKVHTEVDMEQAVKIPLRTAIAASYLADECLTRLKKRISELQEQLRLRTAINYGNAQEELQDSITLANMLECNCTETLHKVCQKNSTNNHHFDG